MSPAKTVGSTPASTPNTRSGDPSRTIETATVFLNQTNNYLLVNDTINVDSIALCLLKISDAIDIKKHKDAIRCAVKLMKDLIEKEGINQKASACAEEFSKKIQDKIEEIAKIGRNISISVERLDTVSISLNEKMAEMPAPRPPPHLVHMYAGATAQPGGRHPAHARAVAKSDHKQRTITFTWSEVNTEEADGLSEKEIVQKAELALDEVRKSLHGLQMPKDMRFISARRLRGKGFQLELNSVESTTWLRREDTMTYFTDNFDGGLCTAKSLTFPALAQFVPITFEPENPLDIGRISENSDISHDAIKFAKWLKPIERRSPEQRTAHLMVHFTTATAANKAILKGMVIESKHVQLRKPQQDPRRCLKCHSFDGHYAKDCRELKDTCGTCGGQHRTQGCNTKDMTQRRVAPM